MTATPRTGSSRRFTSTALPVQVPSARASAEAISRKQWLGSGRCSRLSTTSAAIREP